MRRTGRLGGAGSRRGRAWWRAWGLAAALALGAAAAPRDAAGFCGFYVGGADAKLFNNATQVVLLREGARTVLSMANNYQGPPENFAMVVPVPVVLHRENVKTLKAEVFDRIDRLTAPRLVEYWEQDPCQNRRSREDRGAMAPSPAGAKGGARALEGGAPEVRIEDSFAVGEYDIVILSADDSMSLDTWLRQNGYRIPAGAEAVLRPYVQGGSKFFVAKVDSGKVRFSKGMAELSPLRFHYDDDRFGLPVRLGLLNSAGTQDLIVHVIARRQRYEVANYPSVTVPTNLDLVEGSAERFGAFYAALFDATIAKHPGAVVTEYAWSAGSCDPCPGPSLQAADLLALGAEVAPRVDDGQGALMGAAPMPRPRAPTSSVQVGEYTVTRLHARYTKDTLGEDLVFKKAPPITGGREFDFDGRNTLSQGARPAGPHQQDNFQARYAVRHPWRDEVTCFDPQYGVWGGRVPSSAGNTALTPRDGVSLATSLAVDVPALGLVGTPVVVKRKTSPLAYLAALRGPRASLLTGLLVGVAIAVTLTRRNRRST